MSPVTGQYTRLSQAQVLCSACALCISCNAFHTAHICTSHTAHAQHGTASYQCPLSPNTTLAGAVSCSACALCISCNAVHTVYYTVHILYTVQFQCPLSLSNTLTSPAFCAVHVHIMQCTTYCPYCSVHHWHHQPLRIAPRFAKHCSIMQCIISSAFSANIIAVRTYAHNTCSVLNYLITP